MTDLNAIVQHLKDSGHILEVLGEVRSGKEATVYRVLLDGGSAAMKVYADPEQRDFKNADVYLQNKFYKTRSHARALAKGGKFGKKLRHENWVKREFYMLQKLHDLGAMIPRPILQIDDAIFMEFIGDVEIAAPQLSEVALTEKQAKKALEWIVQSMKIFWDYGIVHADLSAYNILWWQGKPVIIDFPQSVDIRNHPEAHDLLLRDIKNMAKYFRKYFEVDEEGLWEGFR